MGLVYYPFPRFKNILEEGVERANRRGGALWNIFFGPAQHSHHIMELEAVVIISLRPVQI